MENPQFSIEFGRKSGSSSEILLQGERRPRHVMRPCHTVNPGYEDAFLLGGLATRPGGYEGLPPALCSGAVVNRIMCCKELKEDLLHAMHALNSLSYLTSPALKQDVGLKQLL